MNRTFLTPPQFLSDYVESIFAFENDRYSNRFTIPLYANGTPTIVFQTAKATRQEQEVGYLTLYGQTIRAGALDFQSNFTMIAYFLQPHSLKFLFGIEAHEFTDNYIDLSTLKQARKQQLQEKLLNESSLNVRLQLLNDFILQLSESAEEEYRKVFYATNSLKKINNFHSLTELQKNLDITERSLQRLFKKHVGISPRMYRRVCQFNAAFQQINRGRFTKITDVVYKNGFSDQSHFTRVFKEFTDLTPTEYLKLSKDL